MFFSSLWIYASEILVPSSCVGAVYYAAVWIVVVLFASVVYRRHTSGGGSCIVLGYLRRHERSLGHFSHDFVVEIFY